MIENNCLPASVIELNNLDELKFYLTGSRYFNNTTSDSDWDFYTTFCAGAVAYFKTHDWVETDCYSFDNVERIFRKGGVDVMLVQSVKKTTLIQESLKVFPNFTYATKENRTLIWDFAYHLFDAGVSFSKVAGN